MEGEGSGCSNGCERKIGTPSSKLLLRFGRKSLPLRSIFRPSSCSHFRNRSHAPLTGRGDPRVPGATAGEGGDCRGEDHQEGRQARQEEAEEATRQNPQEVGGLHEAGQRGIDDTRRRVQQIRQRQPRRQGQARDRLRAPFVPRLSSRRLRSACPLASVERTLAIDSQPTDLTTDLPIWMRYAWILFEFLKCNMIVD